MKVVVKAAATILLIIALPMMALSRVFLGAHTLNEVLHGTLVGLTLAYIGHYYVKPIILQLPSKFVVTDNDNSSYKIPASAYFKALFFSFILPMSISTLMLCLRYEDSDSKLYHSKEWLARMMRSGCTETKLDPAII